jgi:uncharacterized lipoprotein YehR (DUF1307 family)
MIQSLNRCFQKFLLVLLLLFSIQNCSNDDNKEQPTGPDRDYGGTLRFEYTRDFPAFQNIIDINVDLYKSGDILISQPSGEHYDATGEEPATIKIRETGDIIISSLSGEYKEIDGVPYIVINANTVIDGNMSIWSWDDEAGWVHQIDIPFTQENVVESPMNFKFEEAAGFEAVIGGSIPTYNGTTTVRWILGLVPTLEP